MMIFEVGAFIICLFAMIKSASVYWRSRKVKGTNYRLMRAQSIARLDTIAIMLTYIGNKLSDDVDRLTFGRYEKLLRKMEYLLIALNQVPLISFDDRLLSSLVPMISQLEQDLQVVSKVMLDSNVNSRKGYAKGGACYFCSRPQTKGFATIKVRDPNNKLRKLLSCQVCRASLKSTGEVSVLFFSRGETVVHWSEFTEYQPWRDYWTVARVRNRKSKTRFHIVDSDLGDD